MSSYDDVIEWLFTQLPNYQVQGTSAYKPGLDNIQQLLQGLNNPQELFDSIHIAGTNGKGSVAHILASIYQANGYKVGIFTSPHISDFKERIKINGEMISEQQVIKFIEENKAAFDKVEATFFEITTALAFQVFKEEEVEIAIIETGLGGRLDSTNVLQPALSIITNVAMDHTEFLGDTLPKIAKEKAGIIKQNTPVLIGKHQEEVDEVFADVASELSATIHYSELIELDTDLAGTFQKENASLAYSAVELLKAKWPCTEEKIKIGLLQVQQSTNFQGRFQLIGKNPTVYMDAAHNVAGMKTLVDEVRQLDRNDVHLIYGASNDKDLAAIFSEFPNDWNYYFTEFAGARSAREPKLTQLGILNELDFFTFKTPAEALKAAKTLAASSDVIVICGSFYLMGDILP